MKRALIKKLEQKRGLFRFEENGHSEEPIAFQIRHVKNYSNGIVPLTENQVVLIEEVRKGSYYNVIGTTSLESF